MKFSQLMDFLFHHLRLLHPVSLYLHPPARARSPLPPLRLLAAHAMRASPLPHTGNLQELPPRGRRLAPLVRGCILPAAAACGASALCALSHRRSKG